MINNFEIEKKKQNQTYIPVLIFTVNGLDMTSVIDLIMTSRGFFLHISPDPIPLLYTRSVKYLENVSLQCVNPQIRFESASLTNWTTQIDVYKINVNVPIFNKFGYPSKLVRMTATQLNSKDILTFMPLNKSPFW